MNNNSNHNTVWILGLIVVLVLGVLIGTKMKKPSANVSDAQQGAVVSTINNVQLSGVYSSPNCKTTQLFVQGICYDINQILSSGVSKYDGYGIEHNNGLQYVNSKISLGETLSSSQMSALVSEYMKSTGRNVDTNTLDKISSKIYDKSNYSTATSKYLSEINNINSASVKSVFDQLKNIQNEVGVDTSLTTTEKTNLLSALAVGMYSNVYWYNESVRGGTDPQERMKWWKADLFGFMGGLLFGGGNPVTGLAGAVISSLASSQNSTE